MTGRVKRSHALRMEVKAPAGPKMLYGLPPMKPATSPAKMAVVQPCIGEPPLAMAREMLSGMLTNATESADRQLRLVTQIGCSHLRFQAVVKSGSSRSVVRVQVFDPGIRPGNPGNPGHKRTKPGVSYVCRTHHG